MALSPIDIARQKVRAQQAKLVLKSFDTVMATDAILIKPIMVGGKPTNEIDDLLADDDGIEVLALDTHEYNIQYTDTPIATKLLEVKIDDTGELKLLSADGEVRTEHGGKQRYFLIKEADVPTSSVIEIEVPTETGSITQKHIVVGYSGRGVAPQVVKIYALMPLLDQAS